MSHALKLADEWEHRSYELATELRRLDALVKEQAREIKKLRAANEAFAQRQHWWNDRMFELEQEIEQLRAQRVPLTEEQIADIAERMEALDPADSFWREFARAIEAAHGIHPLQRLADLSKEIGEKL